MALFMAQNQTQPSLNVTDDMEISSDAGHPIDEDDTLIDIDIDEDAPPTDVLDERMQDDLEDSADDFMDDASRDDATNEEIMDDYQIHDEEEEEEEENDVELQDLPDEDVAIDFDDSVNLRDADDFKNGPLEANSNRTSPSESNGLSNVPFADPAHSDNADIIGTLDASLARDSNQPQHESHDDEHDEEETVVNDDVTEQDVQNKGIDNDGPNDFEAGGRSLAAIQTSNLSPQTRNTGDESGDFATSNAQHPVGSAAAQDEISFAQTDVRRPSKAPPCKVVWNGYEFDPFSPDDPLVPFQDLDVAEKPLPEFIAALRNMLRDQIEEDLELEIDFRQLDLSLRENTPDSSCSLVDVNDIYMSLCNNDGDYDQMPLEVTLITRAPFALRYRQLHEAHSSGQGLSALLSDSDSDDQTEYYEEEAPKANDEEITEAVQAEGEYVADDEEGEPGVTHPSGVVEGKAEGAQEDDATNPVHGNIEGIDSVPQVQDFADEVHNTAADETALRREDDEVEQEQTSDQKEAEVDQEEEQDIIDYSDEEQTDDRREVNEYIEEEQHGVDHIDQASAPVDMRGEEGQEDETSGQNAAPEASDLTQADSTNEGAHVTDDQAYVSPENEVQGHLDGEETGIEPTHDAYDETTNGYPQEYETEETSEYYDAPVEAEDEIDYEDDNAEAEHAEHNGGETALPNTEQADAAYTQPNEGSSTHERSKAVESLDDIGDGSASANTTSVATKLSPTITASSSTLSRKRSFSQREADGESNVTNDQKKSRAS